MKSAAAIAFAVLMSSSTYCQKIIIGGADTSRLLVWDDFAGVPEKNSPYDANTFWSIHYNFKNYTFRGDTVKLEAVTVSLELDGKKSWRRKNAETASLLLHEQGHFDIGIICQQEIIQQLNNAVLFKTDFLDKLNSIFLMVLEKYQAMGKRYDEETQHGDNGAAQEKWNEFFKARIKRS